MKTSYSYRLCKVILILITSLLFSAPVFGDSDLALIDIAADGDVAKVKELISKGVDVNAVDDEGYTALMRACKKGHFDCALTLIRAKADVNVRTTEGWTALMYAVQGGHVDCVKELLKANANVDARDERYGTTALTLAAYLGDIESVRLLIQAGADLSAEDSRYGRRSSPIVIRSGLSSVGGGGGRVIEKKFVTAKAIAKLRGYNDIALLLEEAETEAANRMAQYEKPPVLPGNIGIDNPHNRKIAVANIKKIYKKTADDDKPLLKGLYDCVTYCNKIRDEIHQINALKTRLASTKTAAYRETLQSEIKKRRSKLQSSIKEMFETISKLDMRLRKNGRVEDAEILRESMDSLKNGVLDPFSANSIW